MLLLLLPPLFPPLPGSEASQPLLSFLSSCSLKKKKQRRQPPPPPLSSFPLLLGARAFLFSDINMASFLSPPSLLSPPSASSFAPCAPSSFAGPRALSPSPSLSLYHPRILPFMALTSLAIAGLPFLPLSPLAIDTWPEMDFSFLFPLSSPLPCCDQPYLL